MQYYLRFKPAERLAFFLITLLVCALIGSVIVGFIVRGGVTTLTLRLATVIQDCVIFILPALITAMLVSALPSTFLRINGRLSINQLLLAVFAMLVSIPLMNWIVIINDSMSLPESMSGIENWMRLHEEEARKAVSLLLGNDTVASLIIDLLIVGVLAGFSEEILFRGTLQQLFCTSGMNKHVAIWLSATIFSAVHMQFFGFFPRLLLGAYFGYLLWWSRSLWLPVIIHTLNNSIVVYSTWKNGMADGAGDSNSIDQWGVDSPMLIVASAILTAFVIMRLRKSNQSTKGIRYKR